MKLSEPCDKIASAIVAIGNAVRSVHKSGNNTFDRYTYAKLDDYVRACADAMKTQEVSVLASCTGVETLPARKSEKGKDLYGTRVHITMRAVHSSGQWAEIVTVGEGEDRSDKSVYKANTGARKYGYAMLFGLTTTDDPEEEPREPTATTRPVTAKPAAGLTGADAAEAVRKWSGFSETPDVLAATKKIAHQLGVQIVGKMTSEQAAKVIAFVDANKDKDFMEVAK